MEERYVKLQALLTNEETAKKLLALSAEEATHVLAAEYGIDFSAEELKEIMRGIQDAVKEAENAELSETDLEMVAGGKKGSDAYEFGKAAGKAAPVIVALGCVIALTGW